MSAVIADADSMARDAVEGQSARGLAMLDQGAALGLALIAARDRSTPQQVLARMIAKELRIWGAASDGRTKVKNHVAHSKAPTFRAGAGLLMTATRHADCFAGCYDD